MSDPGISTDKLLWLDLEMTGLVPAQHRIIEAAAIITDYELNEIASADFIIRQPEKVLKETDPWVQQNLPELLDKVPSGRPEGEAEAELVALIDKYFRGKQVTLAGNSIHQDRAFIRQWWPELESRLHYRMLDVSSWKIIMQHRYKRYFSKNRVHRADDDIRESIAELKYYLDFVKQ